MTAIGQNYRFRPGKSFLIALTPYILIVIFFIALMALGVAAAVEGIANMQDMQSLESMINQM